MRIYDLLFIVSPEAGEDGATAAVEDYRKIIRDAGVTPEIDEHWGRRRLAYLLGRHREGYYHHFRLSCAPSLIHEVERKLGLAENILRYVAVRIDEDLKRQAKADKKKKPRTGPPSAMSPSSPDEAGEAAPENA